MFYVIVVLGGVLSHRLADSPSAWRDVQRFLFHRAHDAVVVWLGHQSSHGGTPEKMEVSLS